MIILFAAVMFLLMAADPASADPVSATIAFVAKAWAWKIGTFAIGQFLIKTAASMALSALAAAKAMKNQGNTGGIRGQKTMAGEGTCGSIVLGRYATGGFMAAPPMTHGRPFETHNIFLTYVCELGDMPATSLDGIWIGDEKLTLHPAPGSTSTGGGWTGDFSDRAKFGSFFPDHGRASGKFETLVWYKFHDGSQTVADPTLIETDGNGRPWEADMIGRGIPYVIMRFRFKREVFQGLPECLFEVGGIRLYDPRRDTSVGGSGTQRWGDPSTHTVSENPAVQIYNILRGIRLPDGSIWGGNADAEDLPLGNWFAAMNHADELVDGEPRYRASYEIKIGPEDLGGDQPLQVIETILMGCSGAITEFGGVYKLRLGGPGLPVMSLTDDDIIITAEQQFRPFRGMQEAFNGVQAQYPEPAERWNNKEAPPRNNPTFLTQDQGRRHVASLLLSATPYRGQVQRVMQAYLRDSRRDRAHDLTLPPDFGRLEPLDSVGYTSALNGYAAKVFEITSRNDDLRTLLQQCGFRERDSSDYVWAPGDALPSTVRPPTTVPPAPRAILDFAVEAVVLSDDQDRPRRVAIRMTWDPYQTDARGITYRIRRASATADAARGSIRRLADGEHIHSEGILPQTDYQVRAVLDMDAATVDTGWIAVRTGIAGMVEEDLAQTVRDTIAAAEEVANQARTEVQQAIAAADEAVLRAEEALRLARDEADVDVQQAIAAADAALASSEAAQLASGAANQALLDAQAAAAAALLDADRSRDERIASQAGQAGAVAARDAAVVARDSATASQAAASQNATLSAASAYNAALALAQPTAVIAPAPIPATSAYGYNFAGTVEGFALAAATAYLPDDGAGPFLRRTATGSVTLRALAASSDISVFRVTARVRVSAPMTMRLVAAWVSAAGVSLATGGYVGRLVTPEDGVVELQMVLGRYAGGIVTQVGGGANWATAAGLRFGTGPNPTVTGATFDVLGVKVEDLTQADRAAREAGAAANSAAASLSSAELAGTRADAAGSSAFASEQSRLAAQAARDTATGASSAAGIARDAAVLARQSAESASSTAQESRRLATEAATGASQSAQAASESAAAAASSATASGREASAAETSRLGARLGAAESWPSAISDGATWTHNLSGDPQTVPAWPPNAASGAIAAGVATILGSVSGNIHIVSRALKPWIEGRRFRITAEVRVSAPTALRVRALVAPVRADFTNAGTQATNLSLTPTVANVWQTLSHVITLGAPGTGVTHFRAGLFASGANNSPASTVEVRSILIEDVTAQEAAERSRADAEIARAAAVVAKDDAETAMSAASESRRLAAEAQRLAGEESDAASRSADAASESEGRAAGFVTDAGAHALAAERERLTAEVGRSQGPTLPQDFQAGLGAWTTRRNGAPTLAPLTAGLTLGAGDADYGPFGIWAPAASAGANVLTRGVVSARDRSYRITIDFKVIQVSGAETVALNAALVFLDANYGETLATAFGGSYAVGTHSISGVIGPNAGTGVDSVQSLLRSAGNTRQHLRVGLRLNENRAALIHIGRIRVDDVTQEVASTAQAAAAGIARDSAVSAKDDAEDAAASASDSLKLTAEVSGRDLSVLKDTYLIAPEWLRWTGAGVLTRQPNTQYPIGQSWRFAVTSTQQDGLQINRSPATLWVGQTNASAFVIEVEFTLVSGSLAGAGVGLWWENTAGTQYTTARMRLSDMVAGPRQDGARSQTARGVFVRPANFAGTFAAHNLFVFANWEGFAPMAAKTITIHRVKVRPATDEELGAGAVEAGVRANILIDYLTSADTTRAIAALRENLVSEMGGSLAAVSRSASAVANLSGSVARIRNIATVNGEPVGAGIEAVAFNNAGGTSGTLLKLVGDNVVARGTLSADRLVVGLGKNLLQDAEFLDGLRNWVGAFDAAHTLVIQQPGTNGAHPAWPALAIRQTAASTGTSAVFYRPLNDEAGTRSLGVPVTPGDRYCISAYLRVSGGADTCRVGMRFYDAAGTILTGYATAGAFEETGYPNLQRPDTWKRFSFFQTAPEGAVYAEPYFQKNAGASTQLCTLHIWKPQFEETHDQAVRPSPWSPGGTTFINGNRMVTGTFDATRMITTPHIQAVLGRFTDLRSAGLTVGRAEIDTLQLAGNSVTVQWSSNSEELTIELPYAARLMVFTSARIMGTFSTHSTRYRLYRNGATVDETVFSVDEYTNPYVWMRAFSNVPAGTHVYNFDYQRISGANTTTSYNTRRIAIFGAFR